MIESITIRNFQRHKKLKLDLDPHVTTIVGKNDSGKSAIIRALKWVAFNKPAGTTFIHYGEKRASVLVRVDGRSAKRVRSKGKNIYQLDGEILKAFGNDVPPDVRELLNLDDANFQNQHDSPFWFSLSAGEVSRQLNRIVDLTIIDSTLSHLSSELRLAKAEEVVSEKREVVLRKKRKDSANSIEMDKDLQHVEQLAKSHQKTVRARSLLNELYRTNTSTCRRRDRLGEAILQATAGIGFGKAWTACLNRKKRLNSMIEDAKREIQTAQQPIPNTESLEKKYNSWAD
jgi:DNA repair protein SbcC/Rad50